jgi:hypothetical protein
VLTIFDSHCHFLRSWLDEAERNREIAAGDNRRRAARIVALFEGALLMAKVAADPAVFVELCEAIPAVAGRITSATSRSQAIPELL